ncbi:MAG: Fe-S cluster assembly ATPase SufC [Patescibacteria group bacterium]
MLKISNLSVKVGKKQILDDFSYTFKKNKTYAIMGPNGSGKSTLAFTIVGHPAYKIAAKSKIILDNKNIEKLETHKRVKKGVFLTFQSPQELTGVSVLQLIRVAKEDKEKDVLKMYKQLKELAKELHISEDLLSRGLNESASGGERKKLEVLQAIALDKKVIIFDEIDTGIDIDSLKVITKVLNKYKAGKTFILITHYNRVLKYLKPDEVLVLVEGQLKKSGKAKLAERIEKQGYKGL